MKVNYNSRWCLCRPFFSPDPSLLLPPPPRLLPTEIDCLLLVDLVAISLKKQRRLEAEKNKMWVILLSKERSFEIIGGDGERWYHFGGLGVRWKRGEWCWRKKYEISPLGCSCVIASDRLLIDWIIFCWLIIMDTNYLVESMKVGKKPHLWLVYQLEKAHLQEASEMGEAH